MNFIYISWEKGICQKGVHYWVVNLRPHGYGVSHIPHVYLEVCKDLLPLNPSSSLVWLCSGIYDLLTLSMCYLPHGLLTYQAIPNTFYEFYLCLMSNLLFIIYIL